MTRVAGLMATNNIFRGYKLFVVVLVIFSVAECRRVSGSSRSWGRSPSRSPSYSSRSPSYPSHSPSYPSHSPSNPSHSPSYPSHSPSYPSHSPSYPSHSPSHNNRPSPSHIANPGSLSYPDYNKAPAPPKTNHDTNFGFNVQPPPAGFKPSYTQGTQEKKVATNVGSSNPFKDASAPQGPVGPPINSKLGSGAQAPPIGWNTGNSHGTTHVKPIGQSPPAPGSSGTVGFGTGSHPPSYGWNIGKTHGTTNVKPTASGSPGTVGFGTVKHTPSNGGKKGNTHKKKKVKPVGNYRNNTGSQGTGSGAHPPPIGWNTGNTHTPVKNVHPVAAPPPGFSSAVQPPSYVPHYQAPQHQQTYNPAGYGPPAPAHYPQQNYYQPGYGGGYHYPAQPHYPNSVGGTNIHITNINAPAHPYGGLGYSYPSYHYSSHDTGSGTLGFFLGYSLAKITTPTYHYHSGSSYTPRYDHYEVHHYYHNRENIPKESTIQPNAIVGCVGDSGRICPAGTTSLCTSNAVILCVASATSAVPCSDANQGSCIKSVVPCVNGTCPNGQNETVSIPCISKAKVMGNITYVNNTIIVQNTTIINNPVLNATAASNSTMGNTTSVETNTTVSSSTTSALNETTTTTTTTTETPTTIYPGVSSPPPRTKRQTPAVPVNDFCVTILAVPATRKPSHQEQLLKSSTNFLSSFLVKAFGAQ